MPTVIEAQALSEVPSSDRQKDKRPDCVLPHTNVRNWPFPDCSFRSEKNWSL